MSKFATLVTSVVCLWRRKHQGRCTRDRYATHNVSCHGKLPPWQEHGRTAYLVGHAWKCCRSGQTQRVRRGRCGCQGVLGGSARVPSDVTARLHALAHDHVTIRVLILIYLQVMRVTEHNANTAEEQILLHAASCSKRSLQYFIIFTRSSVFI